MIKRTTDSKVGSEHLRRQAIAYIRQSSAHQIRNNRESSQRQYALADRAEALGWPAKSIRTIDEDQGRTGTTATHRQGFKKLLAEVGAGQVGVVLALEASRLARSNADWHRLVEICVVTQTLLADGKAKVHVRPIEEWPVCLKDIYPPYITWEQFEENQRILRANWYRHDSRGAPRKGKALLQGIVYCGCCGAKMTVFHYSTKENRSPGYGCVYDYQRKGSRSTCQMMSSARVNKAIAREFLHVVSPAKIDISLAALDELESDHQEARRQWDLQLHCTLGGFW